MKRLSIVIIALAFSSHSIAMGIIGSKDYNLIIIDADNNLIVNKHVTIIVDSDTLDLTTNSEGQVTIPIEYAYDCRSGKRIKRSRRNRSPKYYVDLITIIYDDHKGAFTKNWRKYFKHLAKNELDRYQYIDGKLTN